MESWNRDERSRYLILRETRGNFPASRAGRTISISRQSRRQSSARRIRFFELGTAGVTFRETELTRAAGAPHGMKYTDRAPFWRCCMPSCPGSERQVRLSKSDLPPLSSPVSEYRKFFHRADSFHVRLSLSLSLSLSFICALFDYFNRYSKHSLRRRERSWKFKVSERAGVKFGAWVLSLSLSLSLFLSDRFVANEAIFLVLRLAVLFVLADSAWNFRQKIEFESMPLSNRTPLYGYLFRRGSYARMKGRQDWGFRSLSLSPESMTQ